MNTLFPNLPDVGWVNLPFQLQQWTNFPDGDAGDKYRFP
jgi:hypothetical protein